MTNLPALDFPVYFLPCCCFPLKSDKWSISTFHVPTWRVFDPYLTSCWSTFASRSCGRMAASWTGTWNELQIYVRNGATADIIGITLNPSPVTSFFLSFHLPFFQKKNQKSGLYLNSESQSVNQRFTLSHKPTWFLTRNACTLLSTQAESTTTRNECKSASPFIVLPSPQRAPLRPTIFLLAPPCPSSPQRANLCVFTQVPLGLSHRPQRRSPTRGPGVRYHVKNHPITCWVYEETQLPTSGSRSICSHEC